MLGNQPRIKSPVPSEGVGTAVQPPITTVLSKVGSQSQSRGSRTCLTLL